MKRWIVVFMIAVLLCGLAGCRPEEEQWLLKSEGIDPAWKAEALTEYHREPFFSLLIEHPIDAVTEFPFTEMIQYNKKTVDEKSIITLRCIVYNFKKFAGMTQEEVLRHWDYLDYREMVLKGEAKGYSQYTVVDLAYESTDGLTPDRILSYKSYPGASLTASTAFLPDWEGVAEQWQIFDGEEVFYHATNPFAIQTGERHFPEDDTVVVQQSDGVTLMRFDSVEDMANYDEDLLEFWQNLLKKKENNGDEQHSEAEEFFEQKSLLLLYQVSTGGADYKAVRSLRKNGDTLDLWLADTVVYGGFAGDCAMRYYYYPMEVRKSALKGLESIALKIYQEEHTIS